MDPDIANPTSIALCRAYFPFAFSFPRRDIGPQSNGPQAYDKWISIGHEIVYMFLEKFCGLR